MLPNAKCFGKRFYNYILSQLAKKTTQTNHGPQFTSQTAANIPIGDVRGGSVSGDVCRTTI